MKEEFNWTKMRIAFAVVAVISQICSAIAACDYQKLVSIRYQINRYLIFILKSQQDVMYV